MANAGYRVEDEVLERISNSDKVFFKKLDDSELLVNIDKVVGFGKTTRSKVDISINGNFRLQVKSTKSNRCSVVNMVSFENLEKVGKREMLDILPILETVSNYLETGKGTVKLADIAKKEEWREFLIYFLFEGTATGQADKFFQATHLLEVDGNEWVLVEKMEAVDYIWESLTLELRTRKGKTNKCLHVRYGR